MNLQEVEVTINKNGQVTLHVRGVSGSECLIITSEIEKLLGGEIVSRDMTSESLETNPIEIGQRQKINKKRK